MWTYNCVFNFMRHTEFLNILKKVKKILIYWRKDKDGTRKHSICSSHTKLYMTALINTEFITIHSCKESHNTTKELVFFLVLQLALGECTRDTYSSDNQPVCQLLGNRENCNSCEMSNIHAVWIEIFV